jgi:hypothetical protein
LLSLGYRVELSNYQGPKRPEGDEPCLTPVERLEAQIQSERAVLDGQKNCIITARPILLMAFYAEYDKWPEANEILTKSKQFDDEFLSYNVFLLPNVPRFHSEARRYPRGGPKQMHDSLTVFLRKHLGKNVFVAKPNEWQRANDTIREILRTYGYRYNCRR